MYPHERSLVKQFSDKPFAIIGVNSDKDRDEIKEIVEEKNLTWRSFGMAAAPAARFRLRGEFQVGQRFIFWTPKA